MRYVVSIFLSFSLIARETIVLFVPLLIWIILGQYLSKIFSIVPLVLRIINQKIYLLIEIILDLAHRKWAGIFAYLDNGMVHIGKKMDLLLEKWFRVWYENKNKHIGIGIIIYLLCVTFIALPSVVKSNNNALIVGQTLYLSYEEKMVDWFEKKGWYGDSAKELGLLKKADDNVFNETLVVTGISSSLLVRDIPTVNGSNALARLYNDDIVQWNGKLIFAEADNGHIEAWVEVKTKEGISGWSRLYYLRPEQYMEKEYIVTERE